MALAGDHEASIAQPCHDPTHHYRVGAHDCGESLGCHRHIKRRHVKEDVQHAGQSTV
jgi:hypothetical protein